MIIFSYRRDDIHIDNMMRDDEIIYTILIFFTSTLIKPNDSMGTAYTIKDF